jgi:hypothetical protein
MQIEVHRIEATALHVRQDDAADVLEEGIAPAQPLGTSSQPIVAAASMKPPIGTFTPRMCASISSPWR